jgi:uncharacterized protein YecE (DUF72 family)
LGIWLGCSGWSYDEWVGPLYPDKATKKFSYYNHFFKAAEIDSTFYTYPKPGMILGLARNSSTDFVFTAKFPRLITHDAALEPSRQLEEDTKNFLDVMRPLGRARRLGALLLQLPPSFDFGRLGDLAQFLESLPTDLRYAAEFRHNSWIREETWGLLRKHGVAYTIVDEPLLPPEVQTTTDFAYVRWHGHGINPWFNFRYADEQLQEWIPKLREIGKRTKETYGMFNNHFHGYAPENCLKVMEMLGVATPEQEALRRKITDYIDGTQKVKQTKLRAPDASGKGGRQMARASDLLAAIMDPARLKRAREIASGEIVLDEVAASVVRGHVRDYSIVIDMGARSIEHDCDDWAKGIGERRLCKHVGAFILALPPERAIEVLQGLGLEGSSRLAFKAKGKPE